MLRLIVALMAVLAMVIVPSTANCNKFISSLLKNYNSGPCKKALTLANKGKCPPSGVLKSCSKKLVKTGKQIKKSCDKKTAKSVQKSANKELNKVKKAKKKCPKAVSDFLKQIKPAFG